MSPAVQKQLDVVSKKLNGERPPHGVSKPLEDIATLLAKEELYKRFNVNRGRTAGFSAWKHVISNPKMEAIVEHDVKSEMTKPNGEYADEIDATVARKYRQLLPALATQAAHEATLKTFEQLRTEMVAAGEWDRGYLEAGNNLAVNPLDFGGKHKGDKAGLGQACRAACEDHAACRGYTYNPGQGACYLKTAASPVRGVSCTHDCWYWGRVIGHPHKMSLSLKDARRDLGLQATDETVGTGEEIRKGSTATIGYVGTLDDGRVFDEGQYTFAFGQGQVIQGDDLGLQGMRVGGRRKLVIPPSLGYGREGYGSLIPGNSVLHFDVTLKAVRPGAIAGGYKNSDTP